MPGADSIGYDPAQNLVYIVTGGKDVDMKSSELAAVDPDTGQKKGALSLDDNHVEAMALETNGNRLFINLTQTNKIAVIDRKAMKVIAIWPVPRRNRMRWLPSTSLIIVCTWDVVNPVW